MIERYRDQHIWQLRQNESRFARYRDILIRVAEAREKLNLVPAGTAQAIRQTPIPMVDQVELRERSTRHDVAAFIDIFEHEMRRTGSGEFARFLFWGFTSSDLVDTTNALLMKTAWKYLRMAANELAVDALPAPGTTPTRIGRTHGQRAYEVSQWDAHQRLASSLFTLIEDEYPRFYGKLSGPTGQHNGPMTEQVEFSVLYQLDVGVDSHATQITNRMEYAKLGFICVQLVSACEQFALQVRLRSQDGIAELRENFGVHQKGSSSMPHKRNPVTAEKICGLARVARGLFIPLLETNGAMWDQRDISNSSVERVALWDLIELTGYLLKQTHQLMDGLFFLHPTDADIEWKSSADKLNDMIGAGIDRDTAYGQLRGEDSSTEGVAQKENFVSSDGIATRSDSPPDDHS